MEGAAVVALARAQGMCALLRDAEVSEAPAQLRAAWGRWTQGKNARSIRQRWMISAHKTGGPCNRTSVRATTCCFGRTRTGWPRSRTEMRARRLHGLVWGPHACVRTARPPPLLRVAENRALSREARRHGVRAGECDGAGCVRKGSGGRLRDGQGMHRSGTWTPPWAEQDGSFALDRPGSPRARCPPFGVSPARPDLPP